jgi:hypothetical protein
VFEQWVLKKSQVTESGHWALGNSLAWRERE